jgi:maleylacetoacetate isomerase
MNKNVDTPILYGYWRSSASWRVRWAFALKKVDFRYVPINLLKGEHKAPEHLKRNPAGAVPVLELPSGEFIAQSMAQLFWMEEAYGGISLFLKDKPARYKVLELCELINADTAPLQTPRAQKAHSSDAKEQKKWAQNFIFSGLESFEKSLASCSGIYCVGDSLSAADLFLIPQIYNAKRFEVDLSAFPKISGIWEECFKTPECKFSAPENQVDAIKTEG